MTATIATIAAMTVVAVAIIARDVALRWLGKVEASELGRRLAVLEESQPRLHEDAVKLERRVTRVESEQGARVRR